MVSLLQINFGINLFSKLYINLVLFLEMREFNPSYQILLSLFNILNVFYDNIWVNIKAKICQTV